ncbi:MAG: valine--tRNA ligase [Coprobacillus sp.]|nr:valine--tRNA ligase [Coprobacillus sp.]
MLEKRYDPLKVEEGKMKAWKEKGYFSTHDTSKKPFSMVTPPPNVTGRLHIGHAWDSALQDIICRYKRMKGYDVLFLPGMDHAGIATEAKVCEKLRDSGIEPSKLSREEFLSYAWSWKDEYAASIHNQWDKFGLSADFIHERFTLDEGMQEAVKKVFVTLYNEGLIYKGKRIINWDTEQETALSNIEVYHTNDTGKMYYFKYHLVNSEDYLEVATTRPETMFGDVCLVVNPTDKRYIDYIGKKVINPANGEVIPVIADSYVDTSFGTGVMKCTPAHDPNDFVIGEKYNLDKPVIMNPNGTMNEKCGKYEGLDRYECRKVLLKDIKESGDFIKEEKIIHAVGHSERSGAVVEPFISDQWFLKVGELAKSVVDTQNSKNKITFIPSRFNKTLVRWMENAEDWCISRQLRWGHQIPAYYSKKDGSILVSEKPPLDIENYEQDKDVLDTWFSSALWPFASMGWPNIESDLYKRYFPTSVLVTGYDIIFFWVARMSFQSLHFTGDVPFKKVVIHGLIRDEEGRKMSKSLGNGIDPIEVINNYGADALRYFLISSSKAGLDMRYKEEKVKSSLSYLNKIYNSARYVLDVLPTGFKPVKDISKLNLSITDQWIVNKMEETVKKVSHHMERYNFNSAMTCLYDFVYDDYCSNYLEMSKVALSSSIGHEATYQVLYYCLKNIILLLSPVTPFICEELYLSLPTHLESVNLETYPSYHAKWVKKDNDQLVEDILNGIKFIRSYKLSNKITPNKPIPISIHFKRDISSDLVSIFTRFTFTSELVETSDVTTLNGALFSSASLDFVLPSEEEDEEEIRKSIALEESEIARARGLLSNPGFTAKAPADKVAQEREKLAKHEENLKTLLSKLKK